MGHYAAEMQLDVNTERTQQQDPLHNWFYVGREGVLYVVNDLSMYDKYMLRDEFRPSALEAYELYLSNLETHINRLKEQRRAVLKKKN